jgi:hypothetical protein
VIVRLWSAGSAEGVTDRRAKACRTAASFIQSCGADTAVVEMAYFDDGVRSLSAGYMIADARRWVARRHPSGRVSWGASLAKPELAAYRG